MFFNRSSKRYYLDYAASTPVRKSAVKAMRPFWRGYFANANSVHTSGLHAKSQIKQAEQIIRSVIQPKKEDEVLFTSGGTESNQLAMRSVCIEYLEQHKDPGVIVLSELEHASVYAEAAEMERLGFSIVYLSTDERGFVQYQKLVDVLEAGGVAFVSVIVQSSEIGTTQTTSEIGKIIRDYRGGNMFPVFHADFSQGVYFKSPQVHSLKADMVTFCSQKIEGPKGVGLLYVSDIYKKYVKRDGTPATGLIVGFAEAFVSAVTMNQYGVQTSLIDQNRSAIGSLRKWFFRELEQNNVGFEINGVRETSSLIVNITFTDSDYDSEELIVAFDAVGLEVSSKSACIGSQKEDSRVLLAMGRNVPNSIRFSLHHEYLNEKDIIEIVRRIKAVIEK